jgi:hypothetical protein
MEDIHFLDPLPWNSADVDESPAYPLEFRGFFTNFQPTQWNFHRFLMNFYSLFNRNHPLEFPCCFFNLPHGISTDFL